MIAFYLVQELRMQDYMTAYRATGRPPQPCPPTPSTRAERTRLSLPPLFEPYIEIGGQPAPLQQSVAVAISLNTLPGESTPPPRDVNALPDVQIFEQTPDTLDGVSRVYLQNIVCQPLYRAFSPEVRDRLSFIAGTLLKHTQELRCKAYTAGKIYVPEIIGIASIL